MNVLVTGGTGALGHRVVSRLRHDHRDGTITFEQYLAERYAKA